MSFSISLFTSFSVLPGSAIGLAYVDAEQYYAEVRKDGTELIEEAFKTLFPLSSPLDKTVKLQNEEVIAINTTFIPRREVIEINAATEGAIQKADKTSAFAVVDSAGAGAGLVDRGVNSKTLQGLMPVSG
jgi:hypothetical protein